MTTQPESGTPQPEMGEPEPGQPQSGAMQSPTGELKEGKSSAGLSTRWSRPRELSDLWTGWQPFGGMNWPFRDIKVEEFVDGDQLVVRAEVPGVDPERDIDVSVENDILTITAELQVCSRGIHCIPPLERR